MATIQPTIQDTTTRLEKEAAKLRTTVETLERERADALTAASRALEDLSINGKTPAAEKRLADAEDAFLRAGARIEAGRAALAAKQDEHTQALGNLLPNNAEAVMNWGLKRREQAIAAATSLLAAAADELYAGSCGSGIAATAARVVGIGIPFSSLIHDTNALQRIERELAYRNGARTGEFVNLRIGIHRPPAPPAPTE